MFLKQFFVLNATCWVLTASSMAWAITPSFNCQKAGSRVEKAICSNPSLAQQDNLIAQHYRQVLKTTPAIVEPAFFIASQQHWNASRHRSCVQQRNFDDCLLKRLKDRNHQLVHLLQGQATARINMAIAMIPKQPALAAQQLKRYPNNMIANAWLLYMSYHTPGTVDSSERAGLQNKIINSLNQEDDFISESLDLTARNSPQGVFYLLRAAYDGSSNTEAYSEGCPQYFIFSRHDKAAFDAFGPQYGSSRDARAPYCFPYNDFYNLPQWQQLKQSLYAPITRAYNHTGTMRYASFAHFAVVSLRMSVFPQQYATTGAVQQKAQAIHTLQNWSYATVWSSKERSQTLQLIPAVEQATTQWLIKYHGLNPQLAQKAALGIVGSYLNLWVDWLTEPQ